MPLHNCSSKIIITIAIYLFSRKVKLLDARFSFYEKEHFIALYTDAGLTH